MQLFESVCWAPRRAAPPNRRLALRPFCNDRSEFFARRHGISSHEHIALSSKSLSSCYTCAPITDQQSLVTSFRRGGRAVDCAGLENRKAERPREFESHPLRHPASRFMRFAGSAWLIARSRMPSEALSEGGPSRCITSPLLKVSLRRSTVCGNDR